MRGTGMLGSRIASMALMSLGAAIAMADVPVSRPDVMPSEKRQRTSGRYIAPHVTTYFVAGLNGNRAVARRLRQIERGSLRVENGLVPPDAVVAS